MARRRRHHLHHHHLFQLFTCGEARRSTCPLWPSPPPSWEQSHFFRNYRVRQSFDVFCRRGNRIEGQSSPLDGASIAELFTSTFELKPLTKHCWKNFLKFLNNPPSITTPDHWWNINHSLFKKATKHCWVIFLIEHHLLARKTDAPNAPSVLFPVH